VVLDVACLDIILSIRRHCVVMISILVTPRVSASAGCDRLVSEPGYRECALFLDKLAMSPFLPKKFRMGVAIATGRKGYYKPGTRAWVSRVSRKIRIPIAMYPCRVEERLTIELVEGREEFERMMIYWEQVEYEVSDDDDSDLKSTARSVPKDYELEDTEEFCPSNEMEKLETEFWNHKMVGANLVGCTDRFHELAKLVPHLVTPESSHIKRYVAGFVPEIRGMLKATQPTTIQDAILRAGILTNEAVICGTLTKGNKKRKSVARLVIRGSHGADNRRRK
ncbi:hypothetical protein Tco_1162885, partial [Tanacetum coccineum]